jgi:hypothetical protein
MRRAKMTKASQVLPNSLRSQDQTMERKVVLLLLRAAEEKVRPRNHQ